MYSLSLKKKRRIVKQSTRIPKAYELCLRSRHYRDLFTPEGLKRAIEYLKQALTENSNYAQAYGELAMCHWGLGNLGYMSPGEAYPHLKTAAIKALEIDDSLAEAHMALGFYNQDVEWNWAVAENEFKRAIQLKPSESWFRIGYSRLLTILHCHEESINEMRQAWKLDPFSVSTAACIGEALMMAHENEMAINQCLSVIDMDPAYPMTYWYLGLAYKQNGQLQSSLRHLKNQLHLWNVIH